jgi:hypothetical protein
MAAFDRHDRAFPGLPIGVGQGDDTGTLDGGGYGLDTSQGGGVITGGAEGYSSNLNAVGTTSTPDDSGGSSSSGGGGGGSTNSSVLGPAGSSTLPTSSGTFSSVTTDPTTLLIGGLAVVAGVAAVALVVHRHKAEQGARVSRPSKRPSRRGYAVRRRAYA